LEISVFGRVVELMPDGVFGKDMEKEGTAVVVTLK
jgi:hypothetical protein